MKTLMYFGLLTTAAFPSPAMAEIKCIPLPAPASAGSVADAGAKFTKALRQSKACADAQAYELARTVGAEEAIAASIVIRCKQYVDEQAKYAVEADLGWTHHEVTKSQTQALTETALEAVRGVRAGSCPVSMVRSATSLAAR